MRTWTTVVLGGVTLFYACGADPQSSAPSPSDAGMAGMGASEPGLEAGGASTSEGGAGEAAGAGGTRVEALGGAGAGAGDPPAVELPAFSPGSRLKTRFYAGSDGSQHLLGFFDTELGVPCEFANLDAGGYRCAPLRSQGLDNAYFADPQCSVRATGFLQACSPPKYEVRALPPMCDGMPRRQVEMVGASQVEVFHGASCEAAEPLPGEVWHALAPADPTTFVEGSLEQVDLGGGLSLLVIEAEDGARAPRSFWFDDRPCTAMELTGAGERCVPTPILSNAGFFADETCTTRLGHTPGQDSCDAPAYLPLPHRAPAEPGECTTSMTLVEVTPYESTTVHYVSNGDCVDTTVSQGPITRWQLGDEVDATTLPPAASERVGQARLQSGAVRTAGGSLVGFSDDIFDNELEVSCTPRLFEDGVLRCTPSASLVAEYFSDAGCQVRLHHEPACDSPRYVADEVYSPDECGVGVSTVRALYRIGAAHEGPVYYADEEGCAPVGAPTEPLVTLEPVDPAELVTLTEQVR